MTEPVLPDAPTVLRSRRVALPGGVRPAEVRVSGGRIAAVTELGPAAPAPGPGVVGPGVVDPGVVDPGVVDLGDLALLPGAVDTHVHINEPGRTGWEGFATATAAAAAGGTTTVIDMPLNSIPATVTIEALAAKRAAASGQLHVDVGCWGGIISASPGALADLDALHDAGVFGFKVFLSPSGVAEFPHLSLDALALAAARAAARDATIVVHAESPAVLETAPEPVGRSFRAYLASRPARAETDAVAALAALSAATNARLHVLHLSAADALDTVLTARADGLPFSVETCPHYLTFRAEDVPDGATAFKCAPPIRGDANRDRLWDGLADGLFAGVVTDHSPSAPEIKAIDTGDFAAAWGGIASIQLGLSATWTGARARGFTLDDVVRWVATGPADLVGLRHKGRIAVGADADLVVFDPESSWTVDPSRLAHRHPVTPYAGMKLDGVVRATYLRGERADGARPPRGEILLRGQR